MPALIFDFDGLVIDSELALAQCVIEAVATRGGRLTVAEMGHLFGSTEDDDLWDAALPTWCDPPFTMPELEALLTPTVRARVDALPLMPGVTDLFDRAREGGWKLALATGHAADLLWPRLERLGIHARFDVVVTSSEVARGKPAPDIFLETANRLDVDPADCVVLEDSVPGCEAALAAGMAAIACPSTVTAHLDFPAGCRRVASLADVDLTQLLSGSGH